mgnify:CR=1 FL=1
MLLVASSLGVALASLVAPAWVTGVALPVTFRLRSLLRASSFLSAVTLPRLASPTVTAHVPVSPPGGCAVPHAFVAAVGVRWRVTGAAVKAPAHLETVSRTPLCARKSVSPTSCRREIGRTDKQVAGALGSTPRFSTVILRLLTAKTERTGR